MNKKGINSSEIARLVGVSRSTVTRVINNYPDIPEKTREMIIKAIQRYNYHPNASAQILAGKKTKTIGLFMSTSSFDVGDYLFNFIIVSIVENCALNGYHVITNTISDTNDPECIKLVKEVFYQGWIDAGIFIEFSNHEPLIEELIADGFIVAVMDQNLPGRNELNRLVFNFDNYAIAKMAVDYLVGLNHKKIGVINGEILKYSGIEKRNGFLDGLKDNMINAEETWITQGDYSIAGGYQNMKRILNSPAGRPTAVCCANDSIAFGALRAISEYGLKVPDDISVIGIDDHMMSAHSKPALTTFRIDFTELLKILVDKVVYVIEQEIPEPVRVKVGTNLVERESCRRI